MIVIAAASTAVLAVAAAIYIQVTPQLRLDGAEPDLVATGDEGSRAGPRLQVLTNGYLSFVSSDHSGGQRTITPLACDRAYAAADTVVCLRPVDASTGTQLVVLDPQLRERQTVALSGFPNRTRVSPSGRMVAWTLLVEGHSHAGSGFSTSTGILDTHTGTLVPSLDAFSVVRDGQPYHPAEANFSSVTFADDNRFFASMSTGGLRYLVEGDIAAMRVRTVTLDVERPSLSPDGTRIAFTHTDGGADGVDHDHYSHNGHGESEITRQLSILDLNTLRITHLGETRSVDDQAVWLDDATVAYSLQRPDGTNDVWAVPADGTGSPRVLVPEANSPAPPQSVGS